MVKIEYMEPDFETINLDEIASIFCCSCSADDANPWY